MKKIVDFRRVGKCLIVLNSRYQILSKDNPQIQVSMKTQLYLKVI